MFRILLISLATLLLPESGQDTQLPEPMEKAGTVQGVITSATNGQPVPGVMAYIAKLNIGTKTDSNGQFLILGVPQDAQDLTIEHQCFMTVTVRLEEAGSTGEPRRVGLGLPIRAPQDSGYAEPLGGCSVFR